jgi:hypothetical protein
MARGVEKMDEVCGQSGACIITPLIGSAATLRDPQAANPRDFYFYFYFFYFLFLFFFFQSLWTLYVILLVWPRNLLGRSTTSIVFGSLGHYGSERIMGIIVLGRSEALRRRWGDGTGQDFLFPPTKW